MKKKISTSFIIPLKNGIWGQVDKYGWTTAHYAAKYAEVNALDFIYCVNPEMLCLPNKFGVTPAHLAAASGHVDVLKFLKAVNETYLHATTKNGWNVAHFAAVNGKDNVIDFLNKTTVDCDKEDVFGNLPMMLAHQHKHFLCVKKLMYTPKINTCTIL